MLIGLRASRFRDEMAGWIEGQGFQPFVTDVGRTAVDFLQRTPEAASFLDVELGSWGLGSGGLGSGGLDGHGEAIWRVVRPIADARVGRRLALMAERRSKDLWMSALEDGVATVLPLPAERDVVLVALRLVTRD